MNTTKTKYTVNHKDAIKFILNDNSYLAMTHMKLWTH